MAQQAITASETEGSTYYSTEARGVEYCAQRLGNGWFVSTHRKALGRRHIGGGKHFASLQDLAAKCAPFAGLDVLVGVAS